MVDDKEFLAYYSTDNYRLTLKWSLFVILLGHSEGHCHHQPRPQAQTVSVHCHYHQEP